MSRQLFRFGVLDAPSTRAHRWGWALLLYLMGAAFAVAKDPYSALYTTLNAGGHEGHTARVFAVAWPLSVWELSIDQSFAQSFARSFDAIVEAKPVIDLKSSSISAVYASLPSETRWGRRVFSAVEEAEFAKHRDMLFERHGDGYGRTRGYQHYLDLLENYARLKKAYDESPLDQRTAAMTAKLNEARQRLASEGQQPRYREAESRIRQLLRYDFSRSALPRLQSAIQGMLDTAGKPRVGLYPTLSARLGKISWQQIELEGGDARRLAEPSSRSDQPMQGLSIRGTDGSTTDIPLPKNVRVRAEVGSVKIIRPWLDLDLLAGSSGVWQWKDPAKGNLSDGPIGDSRAMAPMSSVPIQVYLLRNLEFEGEWSDDSEALLSKALLSKLEIRFGSLIINSGSDVRPFFRSPLILLVADPQVVGILTRDLPLLPGRASDMIVFDQPLPDLPLP